MILVLEIIAILFISGSIMRTGWRGWVQFVTILGIPRRRPVDVSQLGLAPEPTEVENIALLESMGFQRLGELSLSLPYRPPVQYRVFVDAERNLQAAVGESWVSLTAIFEDDAILETMFPYGLPVDLPDYERRSVKTSLEDAIKHHREQAVILGARHGPPRPTQDMSEYLQWESIARARYGLSGMRRHLSYSIVRLVTFVYGLFFMWVIPILHFAGVDILPMNLPTARLALMFIGLLLPAVVLEHLWFRFVYRRGENSGEMPA